MIQLRDRGPEIGWSKTEKSEQEWNDVEHPEVEVRLASFRYEHKQEVPPESKPHPLGKPSQYIVGLLAAILAVLFFKR